jgi:ribosomal protein S18 acetylase RimI-like enzyme
MKASIGTLAATHVRQGFDCGTAALNRYLLEQATQDVKRRVAACFVALDNDAKVIGYYTLSSASIYLGDLPASVAKKLPRYPTVPAVRLGRLAVDKALGGQGLGSAMLADALARAIASEIAAFAMLVDAQDEGAANFYRHHGFIALSSPRSLFLPLAVASTLLAGETAR